MITACVMHGSVEELKTHSGTLCTSCERGLGGGLTNQSGGDDGAPDWAGSGSMCGELGGVEGSCECLGSPPGTNAQRSQVPSGGPGTRV